MDNDNSIKELKGIVKMIKHKYERKQYNPVYGELWMSIAKLVENSDYGKNNAESELVLKLNNTKDENPEHFFEGTATQLFERAKTMLVRYGNVSIEPYSKGIESRSVKIKFEPYKAENKE